MTLRFSADQSGKSCGLMSKNHTFEISYCKESGVNILTKTSYSIHSLPPPTQTHGTKRNPIIWCKKKQKQPKYGIFIILWNIYDDCLNASIEMALLAQNDQGANRFMNTVKYFWDFQGFFWDFFALCIFILKSMFDNLKAFHFSRSNSSNINFSWNNFWHICYN